MFRHILIPTDGSDTARKAIPAGIALAKEMGARVTGYCAHQPVPAQFYGEGNITDMRRVAQLEKEARQHAERCLAEIGEAAGAAGVEFEPLVSESAEPYRAIVEAAEKLACDAIFIASHGYRRLPRLLLGSVTEQVLSHSTIPVLVFR
jgi:nucleotide-binding universal stress UspA family protein